MKKHTMHNSRMKRSRFTTLLFVALGFSFSSFSQTTGTESNLKSVTVKHVNISDEKVGFRAQLNNEEGEKFSVAIKDETGQVLFYDVYDDKKFSKNFVFETTKDLGLVFVFKSLKTKESQTFKVSSTTNFIDDYTVSLKQR
ncbi:MAG TPA: hypothetical protein VM935_04695 [Chitinophagaceae bacterium]|jgi:hypothetical protein|nr:hypothetical protein [Chitinophagaceae bacterium]